jgi:protein transport protein SEC24
MPPVAPSYVGQQMPGLGALGEEGDQQQRAISPPAPGPVRGSRRQYAANSAAYIAGDAPVLSGHGHTQSVGQFFSPAAADPATTPYYGAAPAAQGGYTVGPREGQGYAPQQMGQQHNPAYGAQQQQPAYGQQQQPQQDLSNQFGQMGIGSAKPIGHVPTTNLVGLPLNPAELFGMAPPEIRLPANVNTVLFLPSSSCC